MKRTAKISACGRYRWSLSRVWDAHLPRATYIMLNPSTANAESDDQTIRKCIGLAKRNGCGSIYVVNLFAFRATDPKALAIMTMQEATGTQGPRAIARALNNAKKHGGPVIVAWGHQPKSVLGQAPSRVKTMADLEGVKLMCFGKTQSGNPRHPVMLSYKTPLQAWS